MNRSRVHIHISGEQGIFANAYLVETEGGVVAVDSTLTVSESQSFAARCRGLGKRLLAVLITHGHPDHVAGITQLVGRDQVPILALPLVERMMREIEGPKREQWGPVYGPEWVQRWTYPNRLVADGDVIDFDGISYRVHDIGPGGDCQANSIWVADTEPRAAFVGDLVFHGTHAYIADGYLGEWLANLRRARGLLAGVEIIYPGHGRPGGFELLDAQSAYLEAYRHAVRELAAGGPALSDDAKRELTARMQRALPGAPLEFLVALSADAVAAELARGG